MVKEIPRIDTPQPIYVIKVSTNLSALVSISSLSGSKITAKVVRWLQLQVTTFSSKPMRVHPDEENVPETDW